MNKGRAARHWDVLYPLHDSASNHNVKYVTVPEAAVDDI